jgi:hypothetical protein
VSCRSATTDSLGERRQPSLGLWESMRFRLVENLAARYGDGQGRSCVGRPGVMSTKRPPSGEWRSAKRPPTPRWWKLEWGPGHGSAQTSSCCRLPTGIAGQPESPDHVLHDSGLAIEQRRAHLRGSLLLLKLDPGNTGRRFEAGHMVHRELGTWPRVCRVGFVTRIV